jgi:hypothetical protein
MSPPPEQLIRDYLSRLTTAARGRLSTEDRQELVTRTREFIEENASASGPATAMEVATLLSRLGDPAALVTREAARLAAGRDEGAAPPEVVEGRRRGLLRRRSGPASWHWPQLPGNEALQVRLLNGARESAQSAPQRGHPAGVANGTEPEPLPAPPAGPPVEPPIWVPRQPTSPEADAEDRGEPGPAGPDDRPAWPSPVAMRPDGLPEPEPSLFELPVRDPISRRIARTSAPYITSVVKMARANPVEALAVVLLGLGGAVFPPVWLLGVIAALASRKWDYRDKWIGLAGPVLLLVVGTVVGVSLGSSRSSMGSYIHETWVYADVLSRIGAVLGTGYLAWRLRRGRRQPPIAPWTKPHRVG